MNKDMKKEEKGSETMGEKQMFDTDAVDRVEGKQQSSKWKKSKRKRNVAATEPRVFGREDHKKRKKERPIVPEGSSHTKNDTDKGANGEIKKRGKEPAKDASAGEEESDVDGVGTQARTLRDLTMVRDGKNQGRRVSFADSVEVFRVHGDEGDCCHESKFVHGQRFTPEEDATLMEAIRSYTEMKQLGEKGLEMIRSPRKHPELRRCWDVIGKSLPHRPHSAIYRWARILLNRSDERKWTQEENEYIRRFVEKNGTEWKKLAHELGKCDIHVKDTWRRIKLEKLKKGYWTQDEHQKLFDLVNIDLRLKARQNKNPDHRKLRDNISWEAIGEKLTTRNHKNCCLKWYDTLASPLVKKGIWADIDDYILVEALQKDDAVCVEDVDWDRLLDHRSGEVYRQRWNQMVRGIGGHREKHFIQQVELLSRRYCPEMIEYRK